MLQKQRLPVLTATIDASGKLSVPHIQLHHASRAIRLVDGDSHRFLFLTFHKKTPDAATRKQLTGLITDGVLMNGIRYVYLAYTESGLKAGRVILFREDERCSVQSLLQKFGDLFPVYQKSGYGKYAARIGLSFSSTVPTIDIPNYRAVLLDDLQAEDGSITSDGCGMIRDSIAKKICELLELPSDTCVFQIRRGGIKGLLVRYADAQFDEFCTPPGIAIQAHRFHIAYRPSMLKYSGGPTMLELNAVSVPPTHARLNTQFVVLLLTLGVGIEIFEGKLREQLDRLGAITHDRATALKYIRGELDAQGDAFDQDLYEMLIAGQDLKEPYVQWLLRKFQHMQYESLRKKMNIRVKQSCYLIGVVDELGILEEDEVYVNLPDQSGVHVRNILIARNPSYSPGDLRIVKGVNRPELASLVNCLVLSQKGKHSVSDTTASGDLDGDLYLACFDPELIPPNIQEPEMRPVKKSPPSGSLLSSSNAQAKTRSLTRKITAEMEKAAVDTFVHLRYNRLLGRMATAWQQTVETSKELANADYPRALVPLIEAALDIAKTGDDYAKLETQFTELEKAQKKKTNKSIKGAAFESPLQRLRQMVPQRASERMTDFTCDPSLDLRLEDPAGWKRHFDEGLLVMKAYNTALREAIEEEKQAAEDETVPSWRAREDFETRTEMLKREYVEKYFGGGTYKIRSDQRMRASAWYLCAYNQEKSSFAWLGARYLNEIKAHWTNDGKMVPSVGALTRTGSMDSTTSYCTTATLVADEETPEPMNDPAARRRRAIKDAMELKTVMASSLTSRSYLADHIANTLSPEPCTKSATAVPIEKLVPVYVTDNPKPLAPVATPGIRPCTNLDGHDWGVQANGFYRRYTCRRPGCTLIIKERKGNGTWKGDPTALQENSYRSIPSPSACKIARDPQTPTGMSSCPAGGAHQFLRYDSDSILRIYRCQLCHFEVLSQDGRFVVAQKVGLSS